MDNKKKIQIAGGTLLVILIFTILGILISSSARRGSFRPSQESSERGKLNPNTSGSSKRYSLQDKIKRSVADAIGGVNIKSSGKRELFTPEYAREVARKTLTSLNKMRIFKVRLDSPTETGEYICDGGYGVAESCTAQGKCEVRMIGNPIGLVSTWAHYKYYELVERDPSILSIVENDLSTYANTKKISAVQPNTWSFKLIYELWSGSELNAKQKKLAWDVFYRIQHNPSYIDPIDKQVHDLTSYPTPLTFETVNPFIGTLQDTDNLYSIFSSEYSYSYLFIRDTKVENDQPYLNIAVGLYNEAMKRYMANNGNNDQFNPYYFGVAALDLYKITGNDTFLDTASRLADRHINNDCGKNMTNCSSRVYFYHELMKVNAKQEYIQARNSLLQRLFSQSYDSKDVNGYRLGKNAFYSEDKTRDESLTYELLSNSLLVRVLIEL